LLTAGALASGGQSVILDGRMLKFASRKRLNQQKKDEKQFSPVMPIHLSEKQTVG
jgi:hypothetical protein